MKILKNPDKIVFDTENPESRETPTNNRFNPLFQNINGGEWAFLNSHFKEKEGVQHPILDNFGKSYYHIYEAN